MKNKQIFENIKKASKTILSLDDNKINTLLNKVAEEIIKESDFILFENKKDLARMEKENPKYDRLLLSKERIESIASDTKNVALLRSPLNKIRLETRPPNGLTITKITVPFGVIGIIYESRPNVTLDVFSLCLKSGNACMLKGGSDAHNSNTAITKTIKNVLQQINIDPNIITLLPPGRETTNDLLNAHGYIDLIIPRGSQNLINFVRENASIPVIETGAGIVHTYFDEFADLEKGKNIIVNAKTRRVSVCNALDCLIINKTRLNDLPFIVDEMKTEKVVIYADEESYTILKEHYPDELLQKADEHSFGTEFLSYKMSVKTVANIDEALVHISKYSSKHSEAIISENEQNSNKFLKLVDASSVYVNVSTAFTDGSQFGLGAEIGISTQKLHARGPMALEELTSYKWIIKGDGIIRPKG